MKRATKPGRYRIKSVAAQTGVSTATLRAWERRYGLVQPTRSEGGYRLYSDDDVRTITRVRELIDQGYKVGEAIASMQAPGGSVSQHIWTAERVGDLRERLGGALLALDVAVCRAAGPADEHAAGRAAAVGGVPAAALRASATRGSRARRRWRRSISRAR
jgi:DNA-binding transcriptional MerR regulator